MNLLLGLSWLFGWGVFTTPDMRLFGLVLVAALGLAWLTCSRYNASIGRWDPTKAAMMAVGFTASVLAAQFLFVLLYQRCVVHLGPIQLVAKVLQPLVRLMGLDGAAENGILYVQTHNRILPFSVTCEKLGLMIVGSMLSAVLAFPPSGPVISKLRILGLLVSVMLAYIIMRFCVLIVLFREYNSLSLYWNPVALGLQFLPLTALLASIHPISDLGRFPLVKDHLGRPMIGSLALVAGIACAGVCWLGYRPQGPPKSGRVLLDDAHSDWAWAGIAMGREDFGSQPTYSYSALKNYLGYFYDLKVNAEQKLTEDLLRNVDVLVLKTPTKPFLVSEGEAIASFVRHGGGLFLIGDHDNLFGMTSHLNPIAHFFGIRFLADDTFDLTTGALTFYRPPKFFRHPIVRHVEELGFETTCTLTAWPLAEHVIIGYALGRERADYSHVNFFGNIQPDLDEGYGLFLQGVAVRHGRGRVFALSDSTIFSNFSLFQSGRLALFLGALEYLNGRNQISFGSAGFAVAFLGLTVLIWKRRKICASCSSALLTLAVALGVASGSGVLHWVHQAEYPASSPSPRRPCPGVTFESEFSNYRLPEMLDFTPPDPERCYDTFYVNVLRLDRFPRPVSHFFQALAGTDPVVLINPEGKIGALEANALSQFLSGGGKLLLLLGSAAPTEAANTLLQPLGMHIELYSQLDFTGKPSDVFAGCPAVGITGGIDIEVPKDLLPKKLVPPVIAEQQVGAGRLLVVAGAEIMSRQHIGPVFYNPSEDQRRLYRLEYFIFDKLLL